MVNIRIITKSEGHRNVVDGSLEFPEMEYCYDSRPSWRRSGTGICRVRMTIQSDGSVYSRVSEIPEGGAGTKEVFFTIPAGTLDELVAMRERFNAVKSTEMNKQERYRQWDEIKGKAHLYKTAKYKDEFVKLIRVCGVALFYINYKDNIIMAGCEELTEFCL